MAREAMRIPSERAFGADDYVRRLHDARAEESAGEQQWLAISCDLFNRLRSSNYPHSAKTGARYLAACSSP
jgi:hypothetical protein